MKPATELTQLIGACRRGEAGADDALFGRIYDELRAMARSVPHVGAPGETLQPTALVHEVVLELQRRFPEAPRGVPENRATFFRTVALAMRTILRDQWRAELAAKRRAPGERKSLTALSSGVGAHVSDLDAVDFLALDEALDELEHLQPRWHAVVMHRYFAERTAEETAELLGIGMTTVKSDWTLARAWLAERLGGPGPA